MPAREADRNVGVNAVVEAEPMDQPVGGCEIDPDLAGVVLDGRGPYVRCHYYGHPAFELASPCGPAYATSKSKLSTIDA